jgi:hypothetical protein
MAISFECACGAKFKSKDECAGKTVTCKECGSQMTVPGGGAVAAPEMDDEIAPACEAPRLPKPPDR